MPPGTTHQPKKPIQPFVPVRLDDCTELYSHKELCALSRTDPRNELDELSEPNRFKKDMTKPDAYFESEMRYRRGRLSCWESLNMSGIGGGSPYVTSMQWSMETEILESPNGPYQVLSRSELVSDKKDK